MKQIIYSIFLSIGVMVSSPAFSEVPSKSDAELMVGTVVYGAQADAFSVHCEQDATFAQRFIVKFSAREDATDDVVQYLQQIQRDNFGKMLGALKESEKPCKDIEVMLKRLDVMQKLKEVSYLLNGVDPKDIPKSNVIPELKELMPESQL